jgi:hypothetical protein
VPPGWREQYDRMLRWRERLTEPSDESRDNYNTRISDYLHAFFVTCYHINDALEKDPFAGSAHGQAKTYANAAPWLSKCHGVALGSKHVVIDRGPRKGTSPRIETSTTKLSQPLWGVPSPRGTRTVEESRFDLLIDGQRTWAITVADECIREWNDFLRTKGLM